LKVKFISREGREGGEGKENLFSRLNRLCVLRATIFEQPLFTFVLNCAKAPDMGNWWPDF
jgi:hypothetical protein